MKGGRLAFSCSMTRVYAGGFLSRFYQYSEERIMKRNNLRLLLFAIAFSAFMAALTQSFSAERPPFYQGKTLTFIINFAAGGPTDIESRIFAKHLTKHIPGRSEERRVGKECGCLWCR